ncbi:hypothetical protein LJC31_00435 [Synergistaceae bacterium OttesenSCG-928-I11]|nr:hypothetical protein [Synergistaceae bacterium OttesenSCG-928-I11]
MKKSRIALVLFVGCVLATFVYLTTDRRTETVPKELVWNTSEKNVYLIQSDATANISMGGGEMKMNQTFVSRMAMKVLSEDETDLYAVARFLQPEYRVMGQQIPLRIADANIVLNFGRGGEIRRIFYPANFRESETGLLTQIFRTMEIHLAPQAEAWEWRTAYDSVEADYRFHLSGRTLSRETLRYQNKDADSVEVLSSDFSCEISPAFWIDNLYCYEEKAMKMDFSESNGHLKLEMKRISPMPSDTALWNETDDLKTVFAKLRQPARTVTTTERWTPDNAAPGDEAAQRAPLSREEIMAYLDATIPGLSIRDIDGTDDYIRFLSENPEAVEMLPEWLLNNGDRIDDGQHSIFMFALEKCGSTEAQTALTVIADVEAYGLVDNSRAIVALGGVSHINDDSIRFLQAVSYKNATNKDEILANTAILNLGNAADNLQTSDPFAYRDLVSDIRKDLHNSREDVGRSALLLGSLGNIYDDALVSDIAPYTDSDESILRAAAYDALRLKKGDESEKLLQKGLVSEKNGEARYAVSNALSLREPNAATLDIVMDSMKSETNEPVINNMLRYIYKAPDEDGKIDAFLHKTVDNEKIPIDTRRGVINELRKRRK